MSGIIRLIVGCCISLAVGTIVTWLLMFERVEHGNFMELYSHEIQAVIGNDSNFQWLRSAKGRTVGLYNVLAPDKNYSNASLLICEARNGHAYPQIWISNPSSNGSPETITIVGKGLESGVSLELDAAGKVSGFSFSTNIGKTNGVTFYDKNLDGEYDIRLGPNRQLAVTIDHRWYDVICTNKKQYVDINGRHSQIKYVEGAWKIMNENQ